MGKTQGVHTHSGRVVRRWVFQRIWIKRIVVTFNGDSDSKDLLNLTCFVMCTVWMVFAIHSSYFVSLLGLPQSQQNIISQLAILAYGFKRSTLTEILVNDSTDLQNRKTKTNAYLERRSP